MFPCPDPTDCVVGYWSFYFIDRENEQIKIVLRKRMPSSAWKTFLWRRNPEQLTIIPHESGYSWCVKDNI